MLNTESVETLEGNVADAVKTTKRGLRAAATDLYLLINEPVITQTKTKVELTVDEDNRPAS